MNETELHEGGAIDETKADAGIAEAAIEGEILARLGAFGARLPGELGAEFGALAARLRLFEGASGEGYFSHPLALPVLQLPVWVAARARPGALALGLSLAEAAAVGYLHVRLEDDWFDEGIGEPGAVMALSGALFARHQALLARELPQESPFWDLFEEAWLGYGDATLFERRLRERDEAHDAGAFRRVLTRSRPLALPAAAALHATGRGELLAPLEAFVEALAASSQLLVDLLHAEKDRALGNTTHVLWRLGVKATRTGDAAAHAGSDGAAALRSALFRRGGFDEILDEARAELARAEREAALLGAAEITRFLATRAAYMAETQQKVFLALFGALFRVDDAPSGSHGALR